MYSDINEWDPAVAFSTESIMLLNVYETLLYYVPNGAGYHLAPGLATDWSVSEDQLTWAFEIRKGISFHDGAPLNAMAVKASIDRTRSLGLGAAFIWEAVKEIEVTAEFSVVFHLSHEAPLDLIATSQYAAFIYSPLSAEEGREWFNQGKGAGTGPYKIRKWQKGAEVVLERNSTYWQGWSEDQIETVFLKLVASPAVRAQMVMGGEADFISVPSVDLIGPLIRNDDITISSGPSWINLQFLLNTGKYPTDNLIFREALVHSFNYSGVVDHIYGGYAEATNGMIPASLWGYNDNLHLPSMDLKKARRLLEASGIPREDWRLDFAYVSTSSEYRNIALLWQKNLADIGVKVTLKPGPWGMIWNRAKKQSSAPHIQSMSWWPTYPTPGDGLRSLFRTEEITLFNLSHYSNDRFDTLVDEGLALEGRDRAIAIAKYQEAQDHLIADSVAVFVADLKTRLVHRTWIHGVENNPAYNAVFFHKIRKVSDTQ
jgi:peptide/nickel transport system substrate-binding protein